MPRISRIFSAALVAGRSHISYVSKLGIPFERIFTGVDVVDNSYFQTGADESRLNRLGICDELGLPEKFFLASNRFLPCKNVISIVEAYAKYRETGSQDNWSLVLLGDGPEKDKIVAVCKQFKVQDHVVFCGFKPYAKLHNYYGLAGIFIHASFSDTWGLVINEAMAAGLPVLVSTPCGCVDDLVKEGVNGYSFDPHSVDQLANHMIRMASGTFELEAMGQASRKIISLWTPEVFAENCIAAARAAIDSPQPKPTLFDRLLLWGLSRRHVIEVS